MWDSEQFSQNLGSCSQGSQNSSSDLFSQSKMSQLKSFSSFDVWSQPTNSQQMPEVCLYEDEINRLLNISDISNIFLRRFGHFCLLLYQISPFSLIFPAISPSSLNRFSLLCYVALKLSVFKLFFKVSNYH